MTKKSKSVEDMTYEEAFAELEATVESLENDAPTLEESIGLFERGQKLAAHCAALLDKAELRVRQLGEANAETEEGEAD